MSGPAASGIKTKLCPVCQTLGKSNKLKLYQINLTEAVLLCTGDKCTYPMGVEPSQNIIFSRDAASVTFSKKSMPIASCTGPSKKMFLDVRSALASGQQKVAGVVAVRDQPRMGSTETNVSFQQPGITKKSLITKSTIAPARSKNFESYMSKHVSSHGGQKDKSTTNEHISVGVVPTEIPEQPTNKDASLPEEKSSVTCPSHIYPQWTSLTRHPSLGAVLSLLVHSIHLQQKAKLNHVQSYLLTLIQTYNTAKAMCRHSASRRNGEKQSMIERARTILDNKQLQLHERLKLCQQTEESAICTSLQAIFDEEPAVIQHTCMTRATVHRSCAKCRNQSSEILTSSVLKLFKLPKDLSTSWSDYYSVCDKCGNHSMQAKIHINKYPPIFFSYFEYGLTKCSLSDLDFHTTNSDLYKVRGLILARKDTMQMTTWIRDVQSGLWMKCDSKMDFLCAFCVQEPLFDLSHVSLIMWEVDNIQNSPGNPCETQKDTTEESSLPQWCRNLLTRKKDGSVVDSDLDASGSCHGSRLASASLLSSRSCISGTQGGHTMLTDAEHLAECIDVRNDVQVTQTPGSSPNTFFNAKSNELCDSVTFSDITTTVNKTVQLKQTCSKKSLCLSAEANENTSWEPNITKIRKTKGSKQNKSRSAEVERMRERFLKDRKRVEMRETIGIVESCQDGRGTNEEFKTHCHNSSKSSCLMWSSVANGSQANPPKTSDASHLLAKSQSPNFQSTNPLLDRVLKYLPKNVVPPLPLIDIVKTPVTEKSKRKSGTCFQGYVPKYVMKDDNRQPESKTNASPEKDVSTVKVTNRSASPQRPALRKPMHRWQQTPSNGSRLTLSLSSDLSGAACTPVTSSVRKRLMQSLEGLLSPPSKKSCLATTGAASADSGKQQVGNGHLNELSHNSQRQGHSAPSSEHLHHSLPSFAQSDQLLTPVHSSDVLYAESLLVMNAVSDSGQEHASNSAVLQSSPSAVESDSRNGSLPIIASAQATCTQPSSDRQHLYSCGPVSSPSDRQHLYSCGPVSSPLRGHPPCNVTRQDHLTDLHNQTSLKLCSF